MKFRPTALWRIRTSEGPGSPTGLLFGTGAKFPARHQRALYALDWTFGTIYAFELIPDGASYRAVRSEFAWSKPLGVTDATIGADGAMYFTVGGRGAQPRVVAAVHVSRMLIRDVCDVLFLLRCGRGRGREGQRVSARGRYVMS